MSSESGQGSWQARAATKRSQCAGSIPPSWQLPSALIQGLKHPIETSKNNLVGLDIPRRSGILTERELRITEASDVRDLLRALACGEFSSLEVTVAFCKRAAIAQQLARPPYISQPHTYSRLPTVRSRRLASPRYSSSRPRSGLGTSTHSAREAISSALFTGYPSA